MNKFNLDEFNLDEIWAENELNEISRLRSQINWLSFVLFCVIISFIIL